MKKIIVGAILLFVSSTTFGQNPTDSLRNTYKKEFLFNALNLAVGGFEVGYGISNKKTSNRLFLGYYFSESPAFYNEEEFDIPAGVSTQYNNFEGFRAEFQHLYHNTVKDGKRFYGGGYALFKRATAQITRTDLTGATSTTTLNYSANATALGTGIILGLRSFLIENVFVDFSIGGGVIIPIGGANIEDLHLDLRNPYKRSINPRANITFGIAL